MKSRLKILLGTLLLIAVVIGAAKLYDFTASIKLANKTAQQQKLDTAWINSYAGLVSVPAPKTQTSLVFTSGDESFYVVKHIGPAGPFLLSQKIIRGTTDTIKKNYYFDRGKLLMLSETRLPTGNELLTETRTYFKNSKAAYAVTRSGTTEEELAQAPFKKVKAMGNDATPELLFLEFALEQRRSFDLVFEGVAESPAAKYITLSRNGISNYRAFIRVKKEDEFTRELSTNSVRHRGAKLNLQWDIIDNEAVYRSGSLR